MMLHGGEPPFETSTARRHTWLQQVENRGKRDEDAGETGTTHL